MNREDRWSVPPPPGEPETRRSGPETGEEGGPGLREVLDELFETKRETPAPAAPPSRYREGIVPPPGPLPRRFGPPPYRVWFTRLVTLAVVLYGLSSWLGSGLREIEVGLDALIVLFAVLLAVLVGIRSWQKKRREIEALAVVFEPSGVRVSTALFSRRLAWGDLVGLEPPEAAGKDWVLRAEVGGQPFRVRLPGKQDWARRLVEVLQGVPES